MADHSSLASKFTTWSKKSSPKILRRAFSGRNLNQQQPVSGAKGKKEHKTPQEEMQPRHSAEYERKLGEFRRQTKKDRESGSEKRAFGFRSKVAAKMEAARSGMTEYEIYTLYEGVNGIQVRVTFAVSWTPSQVEEMIVKGQREGKNLFHDFFYTSTFKDAVFVGELKEKIGPCIVHSPRRVQRNESQVV